MMPEHDPARSSNDSEPRVAAIETSYKGYRFRSRLEARWAVFFDTLKWHWKYEPQGYVVEGQPYLPDFWVDEVGWVEVKGELDRAGLLKLGLAAGPDGLPLTLSDETIPSEIGRSRPGWTWLGIARPFLPRLLLLGDIPSPVSWIHYQFGLSNGRHVVYRNAVLLPAGMTSVGDWSLVGADPLPAMPHGGEGRIIQPFSQVTDAYRAARSARFEHGESGVS
jgi:hypothetical protein